jgi:hypothetical protein
MREYHAAGLCCLDEPVMSHVRFRPLNREPTVLACSCSNAPFSPEGCVQVWATEAQSPIAKGVGARLGEVDCVRMAFHPGQYSRQQLNCGRSRRKCERRE